MAESSENNSNNIVETLAQALTNSETLLQFQNLEVKQDIPISSEETTIDLNNQQSPDINKQKLQEQTIEDVNEPQSPEPFFTTGRAPLKTPENEPNYELFQKSAEQGNHTALIHTQLTPENLNTAAKLLLQNPEFKDYIGQHALSNNPDQNLQTLQQGIIDQKNYDIKPDYVGEVDGEIFTGGEAYFLNQLLTNLQNSDAINEFFNQLREQINTEVLQKIEEKEEKQTPAQSIEPQDSSQLKTTTADTEPQLEDDPFIKAKKIINEREGELIEDLTPDEAWGELRRILNSPEYKQAQIEDIGYDPEKGHPDSEIQKYLDDMEAWRKQLPYPEFNEPAKPENYEERLNQPKIDFQNRQKQENNLNSLSPLSQTSKFSLDKQSINEDENLNLYTSDTTDISNTQVETQTELPTRNMLVDLEQYTDENSEKILSNTEKTNTVLDRLTQMFTAFIQTGGMQSQKTTPSQTSIPDINNIGTPQQGIPDATLASRQSMIPAIRSKFVYSV